MCFTSEPTRLILSKEGANFREPFQNCLEMTRKYCLIIVPRGAAGSPFSTKLLFGFHNTLFAHANQHFVFILALERDRAMSSRNVDRDLHKLLRISCQAKSDTSSDLAYRLDKVSQLCSPKDPRI